MIIFEFAGNLQFLYPILHDNPLAAFSISYFFGPYMKIKLGYMHFRNYLYSNLQTFIHLPIILYSLIIYCYFSFSILSPNCMTDTSHFIFSTSSNNLSHPTMINFLSMKFARSLGEGFYRNVKLFYLQNSADNEHLILSPNPKYQFPICYII